MQVTSELIVKGNGESTQLCSPEVGLFTCALGPGALLGPGQVAGVILTLGKPTQLIVPPGVRGRITSSLPERVHAAVGYGEALYTLAPIDGALVEDEPSALTNDGAGLILRSAQAGRFYHRPSPDEPAYIEPGAQLTEGQAVGLVEIMKTFSQVHYHAGGGLPARAKLVRFVIEDGAEIRLGDGLIEVEPL